MDENPFLREVFSILESVASDWMDIGRYLHVDQKYLIVASSVSKQIVDGIIDNNNKKLKMLLVKWQETECSPVNWATIVDLVEKMKFHDLIPLAKVHLPKEGIYIII